MRAGRWRIGRTRCVGNAGYDEAVNISVYRLAITDYQSEKGSNSFVLVALLVIYHV